MGDQSDKPVQLEDLLKLKRHEVPATEFWSQFEQDFQQRRLRALMEGGSEDRHLWSVWWRRLVVGTPMAAGAAFAAFTFIVQPMHLAGTDESEPGGLMNEFAGAPALVASQLEAALPERVRATTADYAEVAMRTTVFVRDELDSSPASEHFRRVLNSGALPARQGVGAHYIADSFTSGRSDVIAISARPVGNF